MASSVSAFDTSRLLIIEIFEIPDISIRPIQSVRTKRCNPPRGVMYTAGPVAPTPPTGVVQKVFCRRCWLHSSVTGFVTRLQCVIPCGGWSSYGTHTPLINHLEAFYLLFEYLFFDLCTQRRLSAVFYECLKKKLQLFSSSCI